MVSLAVPIAITITLGVMYFLGLSLNILSMMGLMLAVGMLVDNSVVVSESIHREHENTPGDPHGASLRGVRGGRPGRGRRYTDQRGGVPADHLWRAGSDFDLPDPRGHLHRGVAGGVAVSSRRPSFH